MQSQSIGDKGIKALGIATLLSIGFFFQNHDYAVWLLLVIGPVYLYFAIHKYKDDKAAGRCIDRARSFIIMGSVILAFGIGMVAYGLNVGLL